MNKYSKFIVIAVLILFIILFVLLLASRFFSQTSELPLTPTVSPRPTFFTYPTVAMEELVLPTIPVSATFVLKGVVINNFYTSPKDINMNGDVLIVSDPDYHIVYFPFAQRFLINILESPFEEMRKKAEETFIRTLEINSESACKLNVEVSTPRFANPDQAGQIFPLSFCEK